MFGIIIFLMHKWKEWGGGDAQRSSERKCLIEQPVDPDCHFSASQMETKQLCFTMLTLTTLPFCILTLGGVSLYHSANMIKAVWRIAMVCGGQGASFVWGSEGSASTVSLIDFQFLNNLSEVEKDSNIFGAIS